MANASSLKKLLVLGAGIAAFTATYWFSTSDKNTDVVEPRVRENSNRIARSTVASTTGGLAQNVAINALLRKASAPASSTDIFPSHSWLVAPPPPPPLPAPPPVPTPTPTVAPKPVAPPLPFTFVGALDEKGKARQVFLSKGDQLIVVKASDVVDATYRIEQITDTGVVITYIPLNQQQTLPIQQGGS
jgi:hypothetical protein